MHGIHGMHGMEEEFGGSQAVLREFSLLVIGLLKEEPLLRTENIRLNLKSSSLRYIWPN